MDYEKLSALEKLIKEAKKKANPTEVLNERLDTLETIIKGNGEGMDDVEAVFIKKKSDKEELAPYFEQLVSLLTEMRDMEAEPEDSSKHDEMHSELISAITSLEETVARSLNKEIKAPVVNVDAPIVEMNQEEVVSELSKANDTLSKIEEALTKEEEEKIEKVTLVDKDGKPYEIKVPTPVVHAPGISTVGVRSVNGTQVNPATAEGQAYDSTNNKVVIGNDKINFTDGFVLSTSGPDTTVYDIIDNTAGTFIVNKGGDSSGSTYLRISMDPINASKSYSITTKKSYQFPFVFGTALSSSQRVNGQEFALELVGANTDGTVPTDANPSDISITGATISITSNIATITAANHGLSGGDRIIIVGCPDSALNVGPTTVTSVASKSSFSVVITIADGSYNSTGGIIRHVDQVDNVRNAAALLFDGTTTTSAQFVSKRNGASPRQVTSNVATTTATQTNTSAYTDAFNATAIHEIIPKIDSLYYRSYIADSRSGGLVGANRYTQNIPDERYLYKIRVRAKNHDNFNIPVAKIASISKSGTTTATVVTQAPHGLTSSDRVQIWGVRNQTDFPNTSTRTSITVVDSTTFTIVLGATIPTITDTNGGVVVKINGNDATLTSQGYFSQVIQSISRTSNVMTIVGSGTWATPLPGEYVHVYGLPAAFIAAEGAYKVLRVNGTSLEVESNGIDFTSLTTGGAVIRRTDVRLHLLRCMGYTRIEAEVVGGKGDVGDSIDVVPIGGAVNLTAQNTTTNTNLITASGWSGNSTTDAASGALVTSANSSAISQHFIGQQSLSFQFVVTAVSGTSPTLDIGIEESYDSGTNWKRIYDMPRITATGSYTTPRLKLNGNRIRYVQTVGGTTPSFTRAINRLTYSTDELYKYRFIDRTIAPNTLNSTTPAYQTEGCMQLQVVISSGAITTSGATFTLEGSMDNLNWYTIGTTMSPAASTTASQTLTDLSRFVRVRASTAGVGQTLNYIDITAYED